MFLLKSRKRFFSLTSSPYSISEFTGNGNTSEIDNRVYESIFTSISPVEIFLLTVSFDLFRTTPLTLITLSLLNLVISLKSLCFASTTH